MSGYGVNRDFASVQAWVRCASIGFALPFFFRSTGIGQSHFPPRGWHRNRFRALTSCDRNFYDLALSMGLATRRPAAARLGDGTSRCGRGASISPEMGRPVDFLLCALRRCFLGTPASAPPHPRPGGLARLCVCSVAHDSLGCDGEILGRLGVARAPAHLRNRRSGLRLVSRVTRHALLAGFHLSGYRVNQELTTA